MYVVVDIESSGGRFNEEAIIEIALFRFNGKEVVDQMISLVHTDKPIQAYVQKMTGIEPHMLRRAPRFHELAKRIVEITDQAVLVGHGVAFDYRMLQLEFERLGYKYERNTIDTVNWSRKFLPDLTSYKLSSLCESLGIWLPRSHRAGDDARATTELFSKLLEMDLEKRISALGIQGDKAEQPPKKLQALLDGVKNETGIYYLRDNQGQLLKAGIAERMHSELSKLFLSPEAGDVSIQNRIADLEIEPAGHRCIARIRLQAERQKALNPQAYPPLGKGVAIYINHETQGLEFQKNVEIDEQQLAFFTKLEHAKKVLRFFQREFELCPLKQAGQRHCALLGPYHHCSSPCLTARQSPEYQTNWQNALNTIQLQTPLSVVVSGRKTGEKAYVKAHFNKIEMCYFKLSNEITDLSRLDNLLIKMPGDAYMRGQFWLMTLGHGKYQSA